MASFVGVLLALATLGGFAACCVVVYNGRKTTALARSPTRAIAAGDHWYKQSLRMARLLGRLQDDTLSWPILPEELRTEVEVELKRFWSDASQ